MIHKSGTRLLHAAIIVSLLHVPNSCFLTTVSNIADKRKVLPITFLQTHLYSSAQREERDLLSLALKLLEQFLWKDGVAGKALVV